MYVSPSTQQLLGWVDKDQRPNRFFFFKRTKPEGFLRICTLGDSGTFGTETAHGLDYPAYLQRMIDGRGANNVQVINFGNSWFGFAQTYLMWREVASHYSCDLVIIMPFEWWSYRDASFNHSDDRNSNSLAYPGYLHARYVLDKDTIRLVRVLGADRLERFHNYFRFIPRWQYLRYDRSPPPIVRALLPRLGTVHNPFYYDQRDRRAEVRDLYQRLIAELAKSHSGQVVVYSHDDVIDEVALGAVPENANLSVVRLNSSMWFPYRAPIGHASPWGNEQAARILFLALFDESKASFNVVRTFTAEQHEQFASVEVIKNRSQDLSGQNLAQYQSVYLSYKDHVVGIFVPFGAKGNLISNQKTFLHGFHGSNTTALLAFNGASSNLAESCFLPLDFRPDEGTPLMLNSDGFSHPKKLGVVHYPNPVVNIAVAKSKRLRCDSDNWLQVRLTDRSRQQNQESVNESLDISVAGDTILTNNNTSEPLFFSTKTTPNYRIKAIGDYRASMDEIPAVSTVNIVLQEEPGVNESLKFLTLHKLAEPNLAQILYPLQIKLQIENGQAKLVPR